MTSRWLFHWWLVARCVLASDAVVESGLWPSFALERCLSRWDRQTTLKSFGNIETHTQTQTLADIKIEHRNRLLKDVYLVDGIICKENPNATTAISIVWQRWNPDCEWQSTALVGAKMCAFWFDVSINVNQCWFYVGLDYLLKLPVAIEKNRIRQ